MIENKNNKKDIMSPKNSFIVWIFFALLGWSVAIGSVYKFSEKNQIITESSERNEQDKSVKELNKIMPTAR